MKIGHLQAETPISPTSQAVIEAYGSRVISLVLGIDPLAIKSVASAHDLSTRYVAKFLGLPVGEAHITGEITRTSYWVRIVGKYQVVGFGGSYEGRVTGIVFSRSSLMEASRATS